MLETSATEVAFSEAAEPTLSSEVLLGELEQFSHFHLKRPKRIADRPGSPVAEVAVPATGGLK